MRPNLACGIDGPPTGVGTRVLMVVPDESVPDDAREGPCEKNISQCLRFLYLRVNNLENNL